MAIGGIPLVTAASCDPYGGIAFFRDDDNGDGYVDVVYDDWYYDCWDCFYDDYYYDDVYLIED